MQQKTPKIPPLKPLAPELFQSTTGTLIDGEEIEETAKKLLAIKQQKQEQKQKMAWKAFRLFAVPTYSSQLSQPLPAARLSHVIEL